MTRDRRHPGGARHWGDNIHEVRQIVPLGFVVIPAAVFWMFRESK